LKGNEEKIYPKEKRAQSEAQTNAPLFLQILTLSGTRLLRLFVQLSEKLPVHQSPSRKTAESQSEQGDNIPLV